MEEELVFGFGVSKLSHLQKGSMNMLFAKGLRASDLSCLRAHELAPQAGSHTSHAFPKTMEDDVKSYEIP